MMSKRIQMTRLKPWRADNPDAVIVDRTTKWGNPYMIGDPMPGNPEWAMRAEDSCECFEFLSIPELPVHELKGRDLACWCPQGEPCHADVLLKYAERCAPVGEGEG